MIYNNEHIHSVIRSGARVSCRCLMAVMAIFALCVSCRMETEEYDHNLYPLYPVPGMGFSYFGVTEEPATRGNIDVEGNTGTKEFIPYNELYPQPINSAYNTIGVFLVKEGQGSMSKPQGAFTYLDNNQWSSTVNIKNEEDYYLFGYMPSSLGGTMSASIGKKGNVWDDGAILYLNGVPTVTPADVCVVVGVMKANPKIDIANQPAIDNVKYWKDNIYPNTTVDNKTDYKYELKQGQYGYKGTQENNFVYLLLDHIYANINFEMIVDKEYSKLRKIKLKQVWMQSEVSNTTNITVKVNDSPVKPIESVTFSGAANPPSMAKLFPEGGIKELWVKREGIDWKVEKKTDGTYDYKLDNSNNKIQDVTSIPGYFAPGENDQKFDFKFVYDVYDTNDNLVRQDCEAKNTWQLPGTGVTYGKSFNVLIKIKPTYLYQLSQPDLDNPTIELVTK